MLDSKKAGPLDRPIPLTFFKDKEAQAKKDAKLSMRQFGELVLARNAPTKEGLRWAKLATFGNRATDRGSLRNNDNVLSVTGVELDYDKGEVGIDDAAEILEKAGVAALLYTSPSHREAFPKWRIFAPFSEAMDRRSRSVMASRIAGLFHARLGPRFSFDPASWTDSQSFYYGWITDNEALDHKIVAVDGEEIDLHDKLDETAIGKPKAAPRHKDAFARATDTSPQERLDLGAAQDAILDGSNFHYSLLSIAGLRIAQGVEADDVLSELTALMEEVPVEVRRANPRRYKQRSSRRHLQSIVAYCMEREAKHLFRDYEQPSAEPPDDEPPPGEEQPEPDKDGEQEDIGGAHEDEWDEPEVKTKSRLVLTAKQFVDGFTPPDYLIDGVIQRGYLYSLTARTGHGKTAVALYMAQCIARGEPMHGAEVKQGSVLMLAGENPDDIRARYLVLAETCGFDPDKLRMHFIAGVVNVSNRMAEIRAAANAMDDLMLVIVDTAAAYFPGDETNSNSQQGAYARLLRQLTFLNGKPTVLVCCHPIKNAGRDNLTPMGGSAFLNEVDGNLTLWSSSERQTSLYWQAKFRGPEFDLMAFDLLVASSGRVKDSKARLMPSVVAQPIADSTLEAAEAVLEKDQDKLLRLIHDNRNASFSRLAELMGFVIGGKPVKYRIQRIIERLRDDKLIQKRRNNKYSLTKAGKDEIGVKDND